MKPAAKRCRVVQVRVRVRAHGAGHRRFRLVRHRVCKAVARRPTQPISGGGSGVPGSPVVVPSILAPPVLPAPVAPPAEPAEPGPGPGDGGGDGGTGTGDPAPVYAPVDYVVNNDFEDTGVGVGCFAPFSQGDGSVVLGSGDPIAGASSLVVSIVTYGRIGCEHTYGYHEGPIADGVRVEGDVRIDSPTTRGAELSICAVAYFEDENVPGRQCQDVGSGLGVVHVAVRADAGGRRLARVYFELDASGTAISATIDDAHLYVDELPGSTGPRGGGGSGGGGSGGGDGGGSGGGSNAGRFAAIVAPTNGETFTGTSLSLRLVGVGYDPNVYTNEPVDGKGTNAARLQFFLDGREIYAQDGADAEYDVFKGYVGNLDVAPGQHTLFTRATYVDPELTRDSATIAINVVAPPTYAQTVDLQRDVVLTGSQSYDLIGAPGARIRLNGNGHRIVSAGTGGHVTLKYVDVYDLGDRGDTSAPAIDVDTTGSSGGVTIEDSVFDSSNPLHLRIDGSNTASIRRNLFRSNMRMPIGQLPYPSSDPSISGTEPVIDIRGSSSAPKAFAGNTVGAGPVHFEATSNWTIGGTADVDSNVMIGPRVAFELYSCANMTVQGNFVDHDYYGGWSQGQLLELNDTHPLLVQHNVLMDSSWPVRGLSGEFRYNLVLEAGHQWMVPGENAYVHHNIFVGGDADEGGITGYYDISTRIENNTFDAQNGPIVQSALTWRDGDTTLRSNAFINFPSWAQGILYLFGGTVNADYNGFFNALTVNYTDGRRPAHDLGGGAPTDPRFAGPLPRTTFDGDRVAVWNRTLPVSQILADYRARYTPTQGSAYIDSGDPAGGAGNDVGAVGAGAVNAADRFGSFAQGGWTPPPTPSAP